MCNILIEKGSIRAHNSKRGQELSEQDMDAPPCKRQALDGCCGDKGLATLPEPLVNCIANSLSRAKSIVALSLVCKGFQNIVSHCTTLKFRKEDFKPSYFRSFQICITKLVMSTSELSTLLVEVPFSAPKLQELAVMAWCLHCKNSLETLTLIDTPDDPQYIEALESQEWKLEVASRCTQLKKLALHNVYMDYQNGLNCRPFLHLRQLSFHQVSLSGDALEHLLRLCPNLEELSLTACTGLGPLDLERTPLENLKRFELTVTDMEEDGSLELLRINAPKLESLVLVVDSFASFHRSQLAASTAPSLVGSIHVSSGSLKVLHLELTSPFSLVINQEAICQLERLSVLGDDWPWKVVEELLEIVGHNLQVLTVGATCTLPTTLNPVEFFCKLPVLEYLSLGPELFDLLCQNLIPGSIIKCPSLKELHVEYLAHLVEEVAFAAAVLKGSTNLQAFLPIYNVAQVRGSGQQSDAEYRTAIAQLRQEYPLVKLPT